jgi:hypothetical protein
MSARLFIVVLILIVGTIGAWAGDSVEASLAAAASTSVANAEASTASASSDQAISPWIHPNMPSSVRDKLTTGFEIAVDRVSTVPQCAELFERLGADPFETLKTGLYFPATPARETKTCRRSYAQTRVGEAPTWICRRITSYSDTQAAMVVIHEALHHAGLTERPHDRKAMSSGQINTMVQKACGL